MQPSTPAPRYLLWMWSLYPMLFPFYLMGKLPVQGRLNVQSGVPQIADFYFVVLTLLVWFRLPFRLKCPALTALFCFGGFALYSVFVNVTWAAIIEDTSLLTNSVFYIYDVLMLLTGFILYANYEDDFLKVTVGAVGASAMLQALLSPFAPSDGSGREAVFFNTDNQLGHFCVLAGTILALGARRFALPLRFLVPALAAVVYLALISQCRAGLFGLAVLVVLALLDRPLRLLMLATAGAAVYLALTLGVSFVPKSAERLVMKGEYDSLATRGYDRIVNHPEYLLFGAGEGAYARFKTDLVATELHSSYGSLFFCYGLIGATLFTLGLLTVFRANLQLGLFVIPAFVYGSAHHGVRFAFFWTTLMFISCLAFGDRVTATNAVTDSDPELDVSQPPRFVPHPGVS
jgi:hypothetical protein